MPRYFKLSTSINNKRNINVVNTLFVGTAENRLPEETVFPDDLPKLIVSNGIVVDHMTEKSDLEEYKKEIFQNIQQLYTNSIIKYSTVCPSYSNNKRTQQEDIKYIKHYQCLLKDLEEKTIYNNISIIGCYKNLFDDINIDKIIKIIDCDGYLIIHDTIPYIFSDYFYEKFVII